MFKAFDAFIVKYLHFLCKSLNELLQLFSILSPHQLQILSDSSPRYFPCEIYMNLRTLLASGVI